MQQAAQLIEKLGLEPHPEGGWYRETWRGPDMGSGRAVGTAILFLLEKNQCSHWHKVDAQELWLWQMGDPLRLLKAPCDAGPIAETTLGGDITAGQALQGIVEANHWQAAQPIHGGSRGFTLVSCVVAPGFEFAGFELASQGWSPG